MKNSVVRLKQIASVQTGYSFRSRLEHDRKGNISVIQMKDIIDSGKFNSANLTQINLSDVDERHLIKLGDIILRSRGQSNKCALIGKRIGKAVVAAPLLIIRVSRDSVLPAYLAWFINQSAAQNYLASHARGTSVPMINKQVVEQLPVTVPSIECQHKIINLHEMAKKEQELLRQLAAKREQYLSQLLIQLLQGENNE